MPSSQILYIFDHLKLSIIFFTCDSNTNQLNLVQSLGNNSRDLRMRLFYAPPLEALRPPLWQAHYLQYEPSDLKYRGFYFAGTSPRENFEAPVIFSSKAVIMFAYEELDFRDVFFRILTPSREKAFRGLKKVKMDFKLAVIR